MFTLRQLARQPVKSLIGILLAALSVCMCCVSVGQYYASDTVRGEIESGYTTVALATNQYNDLKLYDEAGNVIGASYTAGIPDSAKQALEAFAEEHPEWYRETARHGLISSYIPDMTPLNPTGQNYAFSLHSPSPEGRPYGCLMAVIRVTELGEVSVQEKPKSRENNAGDAGEYETLEELIAALQKQMEEARERGEEIPMGIIGAEEAKEEDGIAQIEITGVIEEVLGLEAGYEDPTGWTITLSATLPDRVAYEALELAVGERYLCYGMDYVADDFQFRQYYVKWGRYSPASKVTVEPLTDQDRLYYSKLFWDKDDPLSRKMMNTPEDSKSYRHIMRVYADDGELGYLRFMSDNELKMYQTAHMTVRDYSAEPQERYYSDDGRSYVEVLEDTRDAYINGEKVTMDVAEYRALYGLPTLVHLKEEDSVEAFLASEEGAIWRSAQEDMQINFHAFPLIGVDRLGYIADFARQLARVTDGRDFTAEELESGAKVCILSQSLAESNGIRVGDTIEISTYERDTNMQANVGGMDSKDPGAYFYSRALGFAATEAYTVVGLYRQENEWMANAENDFAFTPNTIFAPKNAVTGEMNYSDSCFYETYVLQNGCIEAFDAAIEEAGYPGLFVYYDQGYSDIVESLEAFHDVSGQAMRIGIAASGVIWLLWLLFFPLRQRSTVQRMLRMGARPGQALVQVLGSAIGILVPGAVCGIGLSALSWSKITGKIVRLADFDAVIPFAGRDVLLLAGVQLLAVLVVTLPIGVAMSAKRNFTKRMKK